MAQNGGTSGEIFHGEMDRCRESQGWTTACSGMPERDGEDQEKSPKPRAGSLALLLTSHTYVARTCILRAFGLQIDVMTSFSGVITFVLFYFVFVFMISLKPRPFVQSSFDVQAPR